MPVSLPPAVRAAAAVVVLAALAALTRASSWRKPLATDTGQYLYIGDLILDGGTPYVDAANNKGPMTYLLFAVIRLGAGTSMTAVRLALLAFAVIAALALGAYVAHYAGRAAGALAAVGFALFAGLPALQGDDPNTEQIGIAFVVGSWWLATRPGRWWAVGAGAAAAAATAMNPALALTLPLTAFEVWRASPGERSRRIGLATAGGIAVALPLLLWLLAAGALDDMWRQVIDYAVEKADGSVSRGGVPLNEVTDEGGTVGAAALPARGLWIVGLTGLLVACTDRRLRRVAIPMILWVAAGWARVKVASYEFPHHFYPVLPGLVAGIALGVVRLWAFVPRPGLRWALAALALAVPLWTWVVVPERDALELKPSQRWGSPYESFSLAYPIADFVRRNTKPDDRILVVATDPEVYWLADRRASTPYFDVFPLLRDKNLVGRRFNDVSYDPPKAIVAMPGAEDADPFFPDLLDLHEFPPAYEVDGARVWLLKQ